jgi:hypothetical protein
MAARRCVSFASTDHLSLNFLLFGASLHYWLIGGYMLRVCCLVLSLLWLGCSAETQSSTIQALHPVSTSSQITSAPVSTPTSVGASLVSCDLVYQSEFNLSGGRKLKLIRNTGFSSKTPRANLPSCGDGWNIAQGSFDESYVTHLKRSAPEDLRRALESCPVTYRSAGKMCPPCVNRASDELDLEAKPPRCACHATFISDWIFCLQ